MAFLVVANFKANFSWTEADKWLSRFRESYRPDGRIEVVLAPTAPLLPLFKGFQRLGGYSLGGQDLSIFEAGAYTGEVPAEGLKELGVKYCLVGHSERRRLLGETKEMVETKIRRAFSTGIIPIVGVSNEGELPGEVLRAGEAVVMFEPFEAISTASGWHTVPTENIKETVMNWRQRINSPRVRVVYGGSVNAGNAGEIGRELGIDGVVVGKDGLDVEKFLEILGAYE